MIALNLVMKERLMKVNNKIISVWGNPSSGKTTFSLKLANELAKKKKNVILILAGAKTPTFSTVLPLVDAKDKSLGALLSSVEITQESILKNCILVDENKHLSVISYLHGENETTYAEYSKDKVVDLLILLKHLADYIIIDCSSLVAYDVLTNVALEFSDKVIRLISADLKAVSYYYSTLPRISSRKYNLENHIKVMSNVKSISPKDVVANRFGGVSLELPYTREIEEQYYEGYLLNSLVEKKSKNYNKTLNEIVNNITGEDDVEVKNLFKGFFQKISVKSKLARGVK